MVVILINLARVVFEMRPFETNSGSHRFAWILASENLEASSHYGIKNTSMGLV